MSLIFQYLFKLSISLAVVYLFYHLLLRRLTFYNSNRWYLLLYSISSFLIPFINISPVLENNRLQESGLVNYIPPVAGGLSIQNVSLPESISYQSLKLAGQWLLWIFILGMIVMLCRLLIQYLSYLKVKRNSRLVLNEQIKIFHVDSHIIPFSIGNSIFINQHLHNEEELKEIIRHEFIHVKQKHSIDIFLGELLCVLNWYNPFAWLIRRAIKVNLEFIADNKVLESGLDRKEYQCLLLKVIGISQFSISTQFNFSSLKKRIAMMNKKQSTKAQLLKLLLLLPVLVIVLLAFRTAGKHMPWPASLHHAHAYVDTIPAPPPPPRPSGEFREQYDEFLKRNPSVKHFYFRDEQLVVELKSGQKETYDVEDKSSLAAAEKKYGKIPIPVVPPPPPPPPPRPALPKDVKSMTITEDKAIVILSDGKKEEYDLSKPEEHMEFNRKYRPSDLMVEDMKRAQDERMMLEMKTMQLDKMREEELRKHELLQRNYEDELNEENARRGQDMDRLARQKQKEFELMQKKFQLDVEQSEDRRKAEFEKALTEKGADVNKLKAEYDRQREMEMTGRKMELLRANKERELEMELMEKKFELDASQRNKFKAEQLEENQEMLYNEMKELNEKNEFMQQRLKIDSKNLTPEQKQQVVKELQNQKIQLSKMMEDLKQKQNELNKQIQSLQKAEKKK